MKLRRCWAKDAAQQSISQLNELGLIERTYALERVKVKTQMVLYMSFDNRQRNRRRQYSKNLTKKAPKQASLLKLLSAQSGSDSSTEARLKADCDTATVNALVRKGLASIENVEVRRTPLSHYNIQLSQPLNLTGAQEAVFKPIQSSLQ